ncbi:MAG: prepilin-type N-terminal cleavage/methylation domain-containing protein, partial [Verrucomicrobiota bacterium]|nr:prepilin-type N-terminal cleavage/methylation domain-containing protein [Verrucomicrobiota bacterium]
MLSFSSTNPKTITYSRSAASGLTLIELLVAISVILVLSGITFGIFRGVQNAQARAQAKAELAVIAQG